MNFGCSYKLVIIIMKGDKNMDKKDFEIRSINKEILTDEISTDEIKIKKENINLFCVQHTQEEIEFA